MNKIEFDNKTFKNRNKGKVKTLVGNDEVFLSLLDFELKLNDVDTVNVKDIFEKVYDDREMLDRKNRMLEKKVDDLKGEIKELKKALKEYITQEATVDKAVTNSLDILSTELAGINLKLNELVDKTKFL